MNRTLAFIRLDYITIKPYLTKKNLLIFAAVALIMLFSSDSSASAIGILMFYASIYAGYPFAVGEKSGIDSLYTVLSIERKTVVSGRYLFTLVLNMCFGLLAYVFSFIASLLLQKEFNSREALMVTIVIFLVYSIIQAIQLPIYFKLGYTKAKFIAYLPFIGLFLLVMGFSSLIKNLKLQKQAGNLFAWFSGNPKLSAFFGIASWLIIFGISYSISLAYYKKRDF